MDYIIEFLGMTQSSQFIIDYLKIVVFIIFGTFVLDIIRIIMYNRR